MLTSITKYNAQAGPSRPTPAHTAPLSGEAESTEPRRPARAPRRDFEKTYTGPDRSTLPEARSRTQADKYFARVANENVLPGRAHKALGIGGWVLGAFACTYMALFADFGTHEHVFSPLRRMYRQYTKDLVTLSPSERSALGLDGADTGVSTASDATGNGAGAGDRGSQPIGSLSLEGSLRDPTRRAF